MEIQPVATRTLDATYHTAARPGSEPTRSGANDAEVRKAFQDFVGQTFFGQMLHAMRETLGKPAYLHGGRTEEVFQAQLDQVLAEKLSDSSAASFSEPMYQLFNLPRP